MKNELFKIASLATILMAGAFVSCNENELDPAKGQFSGKKVSFAISEDKTRTAYDPEKNSQINWTKGDKVRIFCDEAEDVKQADYTVDQIVNNTGKLVFNENGLAWGGNDDMHNFYAVYPADNNVIAGMDNGKVTINANLNQVCTLGNKVGNMYETTPDMSNAVMVAKSSTPPVDKVDLYFKPIMTTLEVIVRGAEDDNLADTYIRGISISMDASDYGATSKQFVYNLQSDELERSDATSTVQFFVGINTADGTNSLHLNATESVKLTAFLPPVSINNAHKIKIRVHATGATELTATIGENFEILQSAKSRITLPWITTKNQGNNNWITPLDDDIFVSQMSIPGTHDSATGDGTTYSLGQTQELTLDKQFELGIRAFDLRPAVSSGDIHIYHGVVSTTYSWDQIMERFKYYLQSNPGEFIIILMRHEDEADNNSSSWGGLIEQKLATIKNTINPATGESYTIDFKPDLTIGEMRGKILFLCRDWTKYNESGPTVGGYTGWSHNKAGAEVSIYGTSGESGTLNIQDCYAPSESGDWKGLITGSLINNSTNKPLVVNYPTVKWAGIESLLKKSQQFHSNTEFVNRWSINHTSGYVGGVVLGVYNSVSTTDGYRENAGNNNIKLYNYINSTSWNGSTGIMIMDFVGARTSGSYTVYGDLCPQAIIDNNYKYHMKRKGE